MTCEGRSTRRTIYRVAGQSLLVEAQDPWAANAIAQLFAGWYLIPDGERDEPRIPAMVMRSAAKPPRIPAGWSEFAIAGGGTCHTDGRTSYIDVDGSIVVIDEPGCAEVEVWTDGALALQSPVLTRVVTYALAAAGWSFLTDDVVLLRHEADEVRAWPLRRCFAITPETFAASTFLQTRTALDDMKARPHDKKQFAPHGIFASEFKQHCVPGTLFFSDLTGGRRSQVSRLSPGEMMTRLIRMNPWSCYDRATAAEHLTVLATLVKQSKGYALRAGRDLLEAEAAAKLIGSYACD